MAKKHYKDLENRLDNISAAFLVGAAILEPYIHMGQPRDSQPSGAAQTTRPTQLPPRDNTTDYAAFATHERYGNIYFPYHLEQAASVGSHLRYQVVDEHGTVVIPGVSWSEATEVARRRNLSERPPAIDGIVARSNE
jgi:hypothetical protein